MIYFYNVQDVFIEKLEDIKYETCMQELRTKIDEFQAKYKSYIENLGGQPDDDDQATSSSGPSGYPDSINTTTIDPNIE